MAVSKQAASLSPQLKQCTGVRVPVQLDYPHAAAWGQGKDKARLVQQVFKEQSLHSGANDIWF